MHVLELVKCPKATPIIVLRVAGRSVSPVVSYAVPLLAAQLLQPDPLLSLVPCIASILPVWRPCSPPPSLRSQTSEPFTSLIAY